MLVLLQYGRYELADITREIEGKTEEEVRAYSKVFWERYTELADHDRIIKNIGKSLLASHASHTVGACTRHVRSPNIVSASPFCCMPFLLLRRQRRCYPDAMSCGSHDVVSLFASLCPWREAQ